MSTTKMNSVPSTKSQVNNSTRTLNNVSIKYIDRINSECKKIMAETPTISDIELIKKIMTNESGNLSSTLIKDSNPPTILVRYDGHADNLNEEEEQCRSLLIQYNDGVFRLVFSQFQKIKFGDECSSLLNNSKYMMDKKITTEYCYDGTLITSLWHEKTKSFVHMTRSCINADESFWHDISYGEMYESAVAKNNIKFSPNKFFEKDCHYFTVLVDYRNKNIIDYSAEFNDPKYSKIVFIAKRRNGTLIDIPVDSKQITENGFLVSPVLNYDNVNAMTEQVDAYNQINIEGKRIVHEGLIVKIHDQNNVYQVLKLQTNAFSTMQKILPNNSNIWIRYLELYRKNLMNAYSEYYELDKNMLKIINTTFLNLVSELIKIYFKTRNGNNSELYNILPGSFHTALYNIHGIYINKKINKTTVQSSIPMLVDIGLATIDEKTEDDVIVRAHPESLIITTNDINNYLRTCDLDFLSSLIVDRIHLIDNFPKKYYSFRIVNVGCQDAYTMAKNINKDPEYVALVRKYYRRND